MNERTITRRASKPASPGVLRLILRAGLGINIGVNRPILVIQGPIRPSQ